MNISNIAKQLGKLGGIKSVKSRFAGKSKKEISELMRKVRKGKFTSSEDMEKSLNSGVCNRIV